MKKIILILTFCFLNNMGAKAQVLSGVNTGTARPNALLEIASSVGQHAKNGVHVPYITKSNFDERMENNPPNGGLGKSKLLGVKDGNSISNYIYWNGSNWVKLITSIPDMTTSTSVTVISGNGFSGVGVNSGHADYFQNFVNKRTIHFGNSTNQKIATTSGNKIMIHKRGVYRIDLLSSIARYGSQYNTTFGDNLSFYNRYTGITEWKRTDLESNGTMTYTVTIEIENTNKIITGGTSHSSANDVFADISVGGTLQINVGQEIIVKVQRKSKESGNDQIPIYENFGNNTLILTKLSE